MNIREKLMNIQRELKAPKGQYNSFGKYKYRSCEDILEAVKPLLAKYGCVLVVTDEIEQLGNRFYVKGIATLLDIASDDRIWNAAYAREDDSKKGMDGSQITGTASSYARKYALNGLFCIDDTKDADSNEQTVERQERKAAVETVERVSAQNIDEIKMFALQKRCADAGVDVKKVCALYKIKTLSDMTERMHENIIANWAKVVEKCKAEES